MSDLLSIVAEWESLERGTPEDRACFSALGIRYRDEWLTQADDVFVKRIRDKVHLSAYRFAEWLAWNWWRLRWEPRRQSRDWALAHRMATIGGGYVWPNITIFSDGERVVVNSRPTRHQPRASLRYVADIAVVVQASELERVVELFIDQVRGKTHAEGIPETNLHRIWNDVASERVDPDTALRRIFEALLGFDPDEASPSLLDALVDDAATLGEGAMREVAATNANGSPPPTACGLRDIARSAGFERSSRDAVRLASDVTLPEPGQAPAWVLGAKAAQALRQQEDLAEDLIDDPRLSRLAGVEREVLTAQPTGASPLSFALDDSEATGRVVLRSKWRTGRRFELARLLGDRLTVKDEGPFSPATRAYTYRQKMQRSFAAELLCPFDSLDAMMGGDHSEDMQRDAAEHFDVSELTVRTLLVNHGRLDREELERDFDIDMAASWPC